MRAVVDAHALLPPLDLFPLGLVSFLPLSPPFPSLFPFRFSARSRSMFLAFARVAPILVFPSILVPLALRARILLVLTRRLRHRGRAAVSPSFPFPLPSLPLALGHSLCLVRHRWGVGELPHPAVLV